MNILILLSLFVAVNTTTYQTLNDNLYFSPAEIEDLKNHLDCYLDKTPCDDVGESYKQYIREAIRECCIKCNEGQKNAGYTFNKEAAFYFPKEHEEFRKKFDPEGIYYEPFMAAVKPKEE